MTVRLHKIDISPWSVTFNDDTHAPDATTPVYDQLVAEMEARE